MKFTRTDKNQMLWYFSSYDALHSCFTFHDEFHVSLLYNGREWTKGKTKLHDAAFENEHRQKPKLFARLRLEERHCLSQHSRRGISTSERDGKGREIAEPTVEILGISKHIQKNYNHQTIDSLI